MGVGFAALEDALVAWVKAGSGFMIGRVILLNQDGVRPGQAPPGEAPFATVTVKSLRTVDTHDQTRHYNPARPNGQEVELRYDSMLEAVIGVQVFGSTATGDASAQALAANVQLALGLPSVQAALAAANVSIFDFGTVMNISQIVRTGYESRAALDVRAYIAASLSEFVGYIASVEITAFGDTSSVEGPVDLGGAAVITLGAAAGAGAAIVSQDAHDRGGRVTFTAGAGAEADGGVLFTIAFSATLGAFYLAFSDGNERAAEEDVAEQLYVVASSGATAPVLIDNVGAPLVAGQQYTLRYVNAF